MTLVMVCSSCQRNIRVPDNLVGRQLQCPACSKLFTVTNPEEALPVIVPIRGNERGEGEPSRLSTAAANWDDPHTGGGFEAESSDQKEAGRPARLSDFLRFRKMITP